MLNFTWYETSANGEYPGFLVCYLSKMKDLFPTDLGLVPWQKPFLKKCGIGRIMLWICFSVTGKERIVRYRDVLIETCCIVLRTSDIATDKGPKHKAKTAVKFTGDDSVKSFKWPSESHELNLNLFRPLWDPKQWSSIDSCRVTWQSSMLYLISVMYIIDSFSFSVVKLLI